jgi:hypothetical protein
MAAVTTTPLRRSRSTLTIVAVAVASTVATLGIGAPAVAGRAPAPPPPPAHLGWALDVATHVGPADNAYGSDPTILTWPGVEGATTYANRTVCNTFLNRVLMQAYGYSFSDFTAWMGSSSPLAADWYDAIVAQNRLTRISKVASIANGDVLAVKYLEPGASTSGHVMIATGSAVKRTASAPIVGGTVQYEVSVVDSANSGHGPTDTRRNPDGSWHDGAGVGVLRIYATSKGAIVGYSWSTFANSEFFDAATHPLAIGRLQP